MRYAICYVSTSTNNVKLVDIQKLLDTTAQYNNDHDIRGLLLYGEGNYFQIMEGEKKLVEEIFVDIKKDPRHKNIIQVVGKNLRNGAFDGYKAEMINENNKCDYDLVKVYMEQVEGLDTQTQRVVKQMLEVFVDTH